MSIDESTRGRLAEEYRELADRIRKLWNFIGSHEFNRLDGLDQDDLREQLVFMRAYRDVLSRRLKRHG